MYLDTCKRDETNPDVNIRDLRQQPLKVSPRKSRKRKAVAEGTSHKTPKDAKKKGNPSFVSIIESVLLSTSKNPSSPKPTKDPSPQTFDDFDIDFDTSLSLDNLLNNPHTTHLDQNQPELAQVLSDIDQFDSLFEAPHTENPNRDSDTTTEDVKDTRRGFELKAWIKNSLMTQYFYHGSFDLKLLQSTRQGDFASLQRGFNPLYSIEYYNLLYQLLQPC